MTTTMPAEVRVMDFGKVLEGLAHKIAESAGIDPTTIPSFATETTTEQATTMDIMSAFEAKGFVTLSAAEFAEAFGLDEFPDDCVGRCYLVTAEEAATGKFAPEPELEEE
jgi:hypothetical protein